MKSDRIEVAVPLNAEEKQRLVTLENVVDAKLGDFFEVGSALMEIKNKELYRETHRNFNAYLPSPVGLWPQLCEQTDWQRGTNSTVAGWVAQTSQRVSNSSVLKAGAGEFPQKWQTIIESSGAGKVTSKIVEKVLNLPRKRRKRRKAKTSNQSEQVKGLLADLRAALKDRNVEEAIKGLDRLEKALIEA